MIEHGRQASGLVRIICVGLFLSGSRMEVLGEQAQSLHTPPPQAAQAGYTVVTFSSRFGVEDVDVADSAKPGFKWYPYRFFGSRPKLESISLNEDGSVTLLGDTTGPNGELATATVVDTSEKFRGTAFGGGGYFEATLKFNPQDVIKTDFKGWPSWWALAIEHIAGFNVQWPGQPEGFEHYIEVDFFEYDLKEYVQKGRLNYFGGAMHDWFGKPNELASAPGWSRVFVREVPADTDFTQYHRYGFLWVPATATRDGYAEYYFDDQRIGRRIAWTKYNDESPPPKPPWTFSILDFNHLVLILGTGPNQPMTVKSVDVWQASDDRNLRR